MRLGTQSGPHSPMANGYAELMLTLMGPATHSFSQALEPSKGKSEAKCKSIVSDLPFTALAFHTLGTDGLLGDP